jgi:Family of unknown function (DUF6174)
MHRTPKPLFLTIALLGVWSAATAAQAPSHEDQLAAAEAKWAANKPQVYEFTLNLLGFLPPAPPSFDPMVFRVEDGVGSLVTGARTAVLKTGSASGVEKYGTVEKQFAFIRAALAKRPYRVEIEYDSDLGYPRRVYIDPQQNVADDEYGFTVEGFRSLAHQ